MRSKEYVLLHLFETQEKTNLVYHVCLGAEMWRVKGIFCGGQDVLYLDSSGGYTVYTFFKNMKLQLTLEQHRFELYGSIYT